MKMRTSIKKLLTPALLTALLFFPAGLGAAPFSPGEKMDFIVSWMGVPAGTTTMSVAGKKEDNPQKTFTLLLETRSNSFVSTFYKVRNKIESLIDGEDFSAISFSANLRQGRHKKDKEIFFAGDGKSLTFIKNGEKSTSEIPENTFDSLSSFYYLRTKKLIPGQDIKINTFSNGKLYNVTVKILEREKIRVEAGTFDTIKVQPLIKHNDVFSNKGDIFIWLTDDEKNIPVLIKTEVKIGHIMAELTNLQRGEKDGAGQGTARHSGLPEVQGRDKAD